MNRAEPVERLPWGERGERGVFRAFAQTLALSIREPRRFYRIAARDDAASVVSALAYGFVFDAVIALATFAYDETIGQQEIRATLDRVGPDLAKVLPGAPEAAARLLSYSAIGSLAIAPIGFVLEILGSAAVAWVGLRLTKSLRTSFGTLVRVFSYASWIRIFALLGVTGDVILSSLAIVIGLGLGSYYWVVAVRESQGIDTKRATLAALAGGLVAAAVACVVGIPLLVGLVVWAASHVQLPTLAP